MRFYAQIVMNFFSLREAAAYAAVKLFSRQYEDEQYSNACQTTDCENKIS